MEKLNRNRLLCQSVRFGAIILWTYVGLGYINQWEVWEFFCVEPKGLLLCSQQPTTWPSWDRWMQSMPSYPFSLRSILILSYHPRSLCHFLHFPVESSWTQTSSTGSCCKTSLNHFFPVMSATRCCKMRGKIVVPYDHRLLLIAYDLITGMKKGIKCGGNCVNHAKTICDLHTSKPHVAL